MDQEKIGAFIRSLRKEKGWTQEQLAERLSVSQKSISRWETGKTMPDYALLPALCEALDVNAAELLNGRRIKGETVPKPDVSTAIRAMITLAVRKKGARRLAGAIAAALITLACMLGLYAGEFRIPVESTAELEQVIDEYHYEGERVADVQERKAVGDRLFVLFRDRRNPDLCGLAELKRGILGGWCFVFCEHSGERWVCARAVSVGRRHYCVSYGVNELPGIDAYGVCGMIYKAGESAATDPPGVAVREEYRGAPFLTLTEVDRNLVLWTQRIRYYSQGEELSYAEMEERCGEYQTGAFSSSTWTAEGWLFYALELILLGTGLVFVRYFLRDKVE